MLDGGRRRWRRSDAACRSKNGRVGCLGDKSFHINRLTKHSATIPECRRALIVPLVPHVAAQALRRGTNSAEIGGVNCRRGPIIARTPKRARRRKSSREARTRDVETYWVTL